LKQIKEHINDSKLIEGCKRNLQPSQRVLYELSSSILFNVANRIVKNPIDTQDVLQNTYIKIFDKVSQYHESKGTFYNWITKICINESLNFVNRKNKLFEDIEGKEYVKDNEPLPYEILREQELLQMIHQLPDAQRVIFVLYEIEGYSHEEIASNLKINVNSCRVYLSRAKEKLKSMIAKIQIPHNPNSIL
jgi:RNA polymerase sigma factor (sigma-70 family)